MELPGRRISSENCGCCRLAGPLGATAPPMGDIRGADAADGDETGKVLRWFTVVLPFSLTRFSLQHFCWFYNMCVLCVCAVSEI